MDPFTIVFMSLSIVTCIGISSYTYIILNTPDDNIFVDLAHEDIWRLP